MTRSRWTRLEEAALGATAELEYIADTLASLGVEPSFSQSHARLLRQLVEYVNALELGEGETEGNGRPAGFPSGWEASPGVKSMSGCELSDASTRCAR